jgi:hypothetical protein
MFANKGKHSIKSYNMTSIIVRYIIHPEIGDQ